MIEFINVDIYINTIVIAAGIDAEGFDILYEDNKDKFSYEEYQKIRNDINDDSICDGSTCLLDCGNIFVFIRKGCERKDLTVAHELFHAVNKLLCRAGVNHDADAEPWAYLLGWLTNEYYNRLDDYEKGCKENNNKNKNRTKL